ncbi:FAD-binding oxidoreductase [Cohaesibacter celericrescens]|uniref:FAD-binding PCMH-type domain-containing protein n=1 Tax=Cohaesibacter celericrescens TaxID=2067669 RepID=A0A2N5XRJ8_9HYPH|nr:FAD-binding oxidoreductase [Cohaesibacter celericrescens]PLW77142.1 hypothetical protein C0081_11060 [Cohaesibacter celericrescens]
MTTLSDPDVSSRLSQFLASARNNLDGLSIQSGEEIGDEWRIATFPWAAQPLAILRPANADIIAPLLKLAANAQLAVYPVSRGRNWGLGSRLPTEDALVLDLSGLDRILALDMTSGTVRIEPGVTFATLQARLKHEGLAFHLPSFGGPTDASVLANALERGEGSGAYGDRFGRMWDLDVALTTGERLRTGHTRSGSEQSASIHARPAGPLIEGLFSQSNFGIVLSATIELQPTLPYAAAILADIGTGEALDKAVPVLRRLITSGMIAPQSLVLWDGAKRASSLVGRYAPQTNELLSKPNQWGASALIFSPHPDLMRITQQIVESELSSVADEITVQSDRDEKGQRQETILTGFADGGNVMSGYWGKKVRPDIPGNMDLDRCGFVWLCPVVPFDAEAIRTVNSILADTSQSERIFAALGLQAISSRALHCYVSLAWDRDEPEAEKEAMRAHSQITAQLDQSGFSLYRLGLMDLAHLPRPCQSWNEVCDRLKTALDPAGILSPGRT